MKRSLEEIESIVEAKAKEYVVVGFKYLTDKESEDAFYSIPSGKDLDSEQDLNIARLGIPFDKDIDNIVVYLLVLVGHPRVVGLARETINPRGEEIAVPEAIARPVINKMKKEQITEFMKGKTKLDVNYHYGRDKLLTEDGHLTTDVKQEGVVDIPVDTLNNLIEEER